MTVNSFAPDAGAGVQRDQIDRPDSQPRQMLAAQGVTQGRIALSIVCLGFAKENSSPRKEGIPAS